MTNCKKLSVIMLDHDRGENLDAGVQVWLGVSRGWSTVIFFLFLVSEEAACWEVLRLCTNRISSPDISKVTMDSVGCLGSQIKEVLGWNFRACSLKFWSRYALVSQQQTLSAECRQSREKSALHLSKCLLRLICLLTPILSLLIGSTYNIIDDFSRR